MGFASLGQIALPKGHFTLDLPNEIRAPSIMMMLFYSAQIHLRKVLNQVHMDLYKVDSTVNPSIMLCINADQLSQKKVKLAGHLMCRKP